MTRLFCYDGDVANMMETLKNLDGEDEGFCFGRNNQFTRGFWSSLPFTVSS